MAEGKVLKATVELAGAIHPSLGKSIGTAQKALGGINLEAAAIGTAFVTGTAIAIKALSSASKALYDLGAEFDSAYDSIRIGTGATGEALEGLQGDFREVYGSVPTTMENASKAIADYNTRLGLTGKELSGISKQAIAVSDMLGEDLSATIETSSKAFQQWGIDSKDMGKQMDYIFKVSQSTGTGFGELMTSMQQYGPQLQGMGYSFEQASAMIGQMEKAGVNTSEVLGAMKKAVGTLAKEGINASDGMQLYYEKIKNAGSAAEATALANEVFGARAGSTMADAIRKGQLAVDDFTKSLNGSNETIMGAMWETADAAEKWSLLQQKIKLAFEPFASAVFDFVGGLVPIVTKLFDVIAPVIKFIADHMNAFIPIIIGVVAALGTFSIVQTVVAWMNAFKATTIATALANGGLLTSLQAVWAAMVANPIGLIAIAVGLLIAGLVALVMNWDKVKEAIINFATSAKEALKPFIEWVAEKFAQLKEKIAPFVEILNKVKDGVGKIFGGGSNKNTVELPAYATGGFTDGVSIAGEAGMEAIISFDKAYRNKNIGIWEKAGQMLGVYTSGSSVNIGGVTINFDVSGSSNPEDVVRAIKNNIHDVVDELVDEMERRTSFNYNVNAYTG